MNKKVNAQRRDGVSIVEQLVVRKVQASIGGKFPCCERGFSVSVICLPEMDTLMNIKNGKPANHLEKSITL